MKKQELSFFLSFLLIISVRTYSQDFQISPPRLEFDGKKLQISYDVLNNKESDKLFVWVEIQKRTGEPLKAASLSGDLGDIKAGKSKVITWIPENDSLFLNEVVNVEIKAEKYIKSFNKGSMVLLSVAMPGLGQTKISGGKPYWIMGVAAYGTLAGGLIYSSKYQKTYDQYTIEEDPKKRSDLYDQTQKQMNMASALLISSAAIWTANLVWVLAIPNKYQPLKYGKITLAPYADPLRRNTVLSMRVNF
jgi:hypothetical protein